jgi:hypothetical protein
MARLRSCASTSGFTARAANALDSAASVAVVRCSARRRMLLRARVRDTLVITWPDVPLPRAVARPMPLYMVGTGDGHL